MPKKKVEESQEPLPEMGLSDLLTMVDEEQDDFERIIKLLLDPDNINHNTDLSDREIDGNAILGSMARKYELPGLLNYLLEKKTLRVSRGRKGRGEWVEILKRTREAAQAEMFNAKKQGMGRYFRR